MNGSEVTRLSDSLTNSFTRLYRIGGLALVFVFIGTLTMLTGHLFPGALPGPIFAIGALVTIVCLVFFLYTQVQGPLRAVKAIRDNEETIDALQDVSLELTRFAWAIQSFTFKHVQKINKAVQIIYPLVVDVPIIGPRVKELGLEDVRSVSELIVETTTGSEAVIRDVESALINSDFRVLKKYSKDIKSLVGVLKQSLAQ